MTFNTASMLTAGVILAPFAAVVIWVLWGGVGEMKKIKVTPWFSRFQKPARVGRYEKREMCNCCVTSVYWDGYRWLHSDFGGNNLWAIPDFQQNSFQWRGVAK